MSVGNLEVAEAINILVFSISFHFRSVHEASTIFDVLVVGTVVVVQLGGVSSVRSRGLTSGGDPAICEAVVHGSAHRLVIVVKDVDSILQEW